MFSGLLYCADCGEKLYYSVTNNYKREQAYFFCSAYRKNSDVCSAHYVREKVVEQLVLESMQRVLWYVQSYEKLFAQRQLAEFGEKQKKDLAEKRRELDKAKRVTRLEALTPELVHLLRKSLCLHPNTRTESAIRRLQSTTTVLALSVSRQLKKWKNTSKNTSAKSLS